VVEAGPLDGPAQQERWLLQDLRDPAIEKVLHRQRTTGKW
jgi:hypothetical protein